MKTVVMAAGGIVWRTSKEGRQIVLVHRKRYKGEIALPKGKVEGGRSLRDTALREVCEETGCTAEIVGYAGSTCYTYDGVRKIVFFWHMALVSEGAIQDIGEIEKIEWLAPDAAARALTHDDERRLIAGADCRRGIAWVERLSKSLDKCWTHLVSPSRYDRLRGALRVAEQEIAHQIPVVGATQPASGSSYWRDAALHLLAEAGQALRDYRISEGWELLHAARRMELCGYSERGELPAVAMVMREEADKITGWRQKALQKLLAEPKDGDKAIKAENVYQAALLRDDFYANQAYKDKLLRTQIVWLLVILCFVMVGLFLLYFFGDSSYPANRTPLRILLAVVLSGVLGGTVSAMMRTSDTGVSARIPETTATGRVTFMRILMGGASAVVVYLVLKSQLTGVLSDTVAKTAQDLSIHTACVIAFVAGFSERLVMRAIEAVAGKDTQKDKK